MGAYSVFWWLASAVVILCIPLVLTTASVSSLLYDPAYYAAGQARYAIGRSTEYSLDALRPINDAIVTFFSTPTLSLPAALAVHGTNRDVFSAREVGHMEDVRDLVRLLGRVGWAAGSLVVAAVAARFAFRGAGALGWATSRLLAGALLTVGIVVALGALTLVDFGQLFLTFHLLSFDNDLWILDPRRDNLIRFFPFEFWFDATVTAALRTVLSAVAVAVVAGATRFWVQRRMV